MGYGNPFRLPQVVQSSVYDPDIYGTCVWFGHTSVVPHWFVPLKNIIQFQKLDSTIALPVHENAVNVKPAHLYDIIRVCLVALNYQTMDHFQTFL